MYAAKYHRATSLEEAVRALQGAEDGKVLAGGQTLVPTMRQHLAAPSDLIDIRSIDGLTGIRSEGGHLIVGAATTHAEVADSTEAARQIPALACLAAGIGDPAVRHMGTLGGSVANNDPASDYPAAVLGLGATVVTNTREIAADDFFEGLFTTALEEAEIVREIRFPVLDAAGYAKFPNPASRYAMVGVFVARTGAGVRVAITGAGIDGVFRHSGVEQALAQDLSPAAVDKVSVDDTEMLSDLHGTAEYRAHLVKVMAKRAIANMA